MGNRRRSVLYLILSLAAVSTAACGIRPAERAVPAVTDSVFRDVYDVPVYQSLYESGGETPLRPSDPLEGTGTSNPKPRLGRD